MWLIVGLGNPGPKYASNRHNIGFMAVDAIAHRHRFSSFSSKHKGQIADGVIGGEKVILLKPQTFMNLSGESVQAVSHFFKIPLANTCVMHDELALALGKLRVKRGGGHNGHNGLKSIDQAVGQDYLRMRLGIEHPGNPDMVSSHVLSDFTKQEMPLVEKQIEAISDNIDRLIANDEAGFMTRVALVMNPPPPKKLKPSEA